MCVFLCSVCVLECVSDTVDLMIESTVLSFVSQNTHKSVLQGI